MIENLIKKKEGESAIVTLTKKRIKLNLNMFCIFTGKLGSGKTWSGISYAQELDDDFNVDKQVVFDFRSCMGLINDEWFRNKKIKVILWDEPQISISNRSWQSQINRLVNYLISTFRHQNIVLIMCAPYKDFLDVQTMKLLHWEFQCSSIDRKKKQCIVYLKWQQYNPQKKKTYPHPLFILNKNNKQVQVNIWCVDKPSKESIKVYEKNKTTFTAQLNQSIQKTLDDMEKKPEPKPRQEEVKLPEAYEESAELYDQIEKANPDLKNVDIINRIAEVSKISVRNVYRNIRKAKIFQFRQSQKLENDKIVPIAIAQTPID